MQTKKELKKNLKKLLIIQTAEGIFEHKPYSEITMDEIAEKTGITKKTVYSYFPSKLSLFINIIETYLKQLHERIFQVFEQNGSIEDTFKQLFQTLFEFTLENEKMMRFYWTLESDQTGGTIPSDLSNRINIWNEAIMKEIKLFINNAVERDVLKAYDPEMIIHMFSAINKGIFIHTNKEKRFNIANIDSKQLYDLFYELVTNQILKKTE